MRTRQIDRKRGGQRFSTGLQMRNGLTDVGDRRRHSMLARLHLTALRADF